MPLVMMPTWPSQNTRSPRRSGASRVEGMPELGRLHVGVARGLMARGLDRELHQPRAVETDAGAAAPQIRRAEKGFGDGDEVGMRLPDRHRVAGEHISAAGKGDELAFRPWRQ